MATQSLRDFAIRAYRQEIETLTAQAYEARRSYHHERLAMLKAKLDSLKAELSKLEKENA